jgi:hypothetical protein
MRLFLFIYLDLEIYEIVIYVIKQLSEGDKFYLFLFVFIFR